MSERKKEKKSIASIFAALVRCFLGLSLLRTALRCELQSRFDPGRDRADSWLRDTRSGACKTSRIGPPTTQSIASPSSFSPHLCRRPALGLGLEGANGVALLGDGGFGRLCGGLEGGCVVGHVFFSGVRRWKGEGLIDDRGGGRRNGRKSFHDASPCPHNNQKKEKKENSLLLSHARSPPAFPLFPRSPFPDRRELSIFRVLALEKTH